MTINMCRKHCKRAGYLLSCLYRGDNCICVHGVDDTASVPVGDQYCQTRCNGDDNQVCGDETNLVSVYDGNPLA